MPMLSDDELLVAIYKSLATSTNALIEKLEPEDLVAAKRRIVKGPKRGRDAIGGEGVNKNPSVVFFIPPGLNRREPETAWQVVDYVVNVHVDDRRDGRADVKQLSELSDIVFNILHANEIESPTTSQLTTLNNNLVRGRIKKTYLTGRSDTNFNRRDPHEHFSSLLFRLYCTAP